MYNGMVARCTKEWPGAGESDVMQGLIIARKFCAEDGVELFLRNTQKLTSDIICVAVY